MERKQEDYCVLEVNLISAQDLKVPAAGNHHPAEIYAVVWVEDPSTKLRSRIDSSAAENPTWNDKFLFRVSPEFVRSPTAAVSVQIYAVCRFKDSLVGSARCLVSSCLGKFINSVHVHRPSGSFHGILNLGAAVCDGFDHFFKESGSSAVNFQEMFTKKKKETKKKSTGLFGTLRLVKSATSISTMASMMLPQNETPSTLRPVKSEPNISTMLSTYSHVFLDPDVDS